MNLLVRQIGTVSSNKNFPETLPADWYHSADVFAAEREQVFAAAWWLIGPAADIALPGTALAATVAGWSVIAVRDDNGDVRGFHNVCRHRAGPLMKPGAHKCRALVCRYHGWRYDMNGALRNAPGMTQDDGLSYDNMGLFPVRVSIWNGMVFVCIDENASTLIDWLGDAVTIAERFPSVDTMTFQETVDRTAQANWKTYADNSCEGYHVGLVHRDLDQAVDGDSVDIRAYPNGAFVGFDVTYAPTPADPSRAGQGFWIYKPPGLLLHFAEFAFNAETVSPISSNQSDIRCWFWADEAAAKAQGVNPDTIPTHSAEVVDEDIGICEAVQKNLEGGVYSSGKLSPANEPGTVFFQQWVRDNFTP